MITAFGGSVPCLRALAAGGPGGALVGDAVNAVSKHGRTALDWALEMNHAECAAVLRDELGGKRAADLGNSNDEPRSQVLMVAATVPGGQTMPLRVHSQGALMNVVVPPSVAVGQWFVFVADEQFQGPV